MRWKLLLSLCAPNLAHAQIDYRNLDHDRPAATEDAYPVERYAFELVGGGQLQRYSGEWIYASSWGIAYGLLPNAEIALGAGMVDGRLEGGTVSGLYNANTEGPLLPALGVRATANLDDPWLSIGVLATRSFGLQRVHLNAGKTFGGPADGEFASAAVDRTLWRHSALLVGEVVVRRAPATPLDVVATVGARYQWRTATVLDLGVTRGLRAGGPEFGVSLGLSVLFGLRGLTPGAKS